MRTGSNRNTASERTEERQGLTKRTDAQTRRAGKRTSGKITGTGWIRDLKTQYI